MKCPSCGVWNRAHFTKCFRCGAPLPESKPLIPQDSVDGETGEIFPGGAEVQSDPVQAEFPAGRENPAEEPVPAADAEALKEVPSPELDATSPGDEIGESEPENAPESPADEDAPPFDGAGIFSLYDAGNWDDEEEEDTDEIYGVPSAPQPAAPLIRPVPVAEADAEAEDAHTPPPPDEEEDEPVTVYRAPEKPAGQPSQETRRFKPVEEGTGDTRRFAPAADQEAQPEAQASSAPLSEPEVAPAQPGISHEIIHAIFTNPPSAMSPDYMDEPRPRKLMSLKRVPQPPAAEEEPPTVYKPKEAKAEPRVDHVEEFKPTARIAAQKADEQGNEFTAFATAKRSLVAEVQDTDPFAEAIELPKNEKAAGQEPQEPEGEPSPAPEALEPQMQRRQEQPAWVQEALFNLEQENAPSSRRETPLSRRAPQHAGAPLSHRRAPQESEEEPPTRYERPRPVREREAPPPQPQQPLREPQRPAYSGLEAIARHESARSTSVLQQRAGRAAEAQQHAGHGAARPDEAGQDRSFRTPQGDEASEEPIARVSSRKMPSSARSSSQTQRRSDAASQDTPMRMHSSRAAAKPAAASGMTVGRRLRVENLTRVIIVGVAALVLLGLLIWGIVAGVRAILNRTPSGSSNAGTVSSAPEDPNAPSITTGTVNGRPGHIITFKGEDDDIIYISGENLAASYNIPIVNGEGSLQLEDSVLIGARYVSQDVEVTLYPVLHKAGSGKEINLDPVTFTVTPPDAYLEIVRPEGGAAETTLGSYQVKIRVEAGSKVTIDGNDVSDMITEEEDGLGSIVTNVTVQAIGENSIPIEVMKEGCKSVSQNLLLTRPVMTVPIELDAATPSSVQSNTVDISGKVEAGVKVEVASPVSGNVTVNDDGSFSFVAKLDSFGDNEVVITATKDEESSTLTHVITYIPTYNDYVAQAYRMDYNSLTSFAGAFRPFQCHGTVVEVYQQEPYTCLFNVGSAEDPKYIYLEMAEGKPLSTDKVYDVFADVHVSGTKEGYPYMLGRYFRETDEAATPADPSAE